MGSNPYCYYAPYDTDFDAALQRLRLQEFEAGRYDPALRAANPPTYAFKQQFPPGPAFPSPGAQHASIDAAISAAGDGGTGSILDIFGVSRAPQLCFATVVSDDLSRVLFGTPRPGRAQVDALIWDRQGILRLSEADRTRRLQTLTNFWDPIGRGEARIVVVYDAEPAALFFAGMTLD